MRKDHMRKTPKIIVSLMLTAAMTVSMFSAVMAEETVDVQTGDVQVVETNEPVAEEPAVVSEPENEQQDKPLAAESEEVIVKDEDAGRYTAEDISNGDQLPEVVLEHLGNETVDLASVSQDEYTIVRHPERVVIKNNATTADPDKDLYAAVLFKGEENQKKTLYVGVKIPAGGSEVSIYHMFNKSGDDQPIDKADNDKDYEILFGRELTWEDEETKETVHSGFAVIGWKDDGTEYNIEGRADAPGGDKIVPETPIDWVDGLTGIQMKAGVTKNMQIKISWAPNGKDETQKTFKKYELYELIEDSTDPDAVHGYKKVQRWPLDKSKNPGGKSTSKSATLTPAMNGDNILDSSLLYLLECYDKDDKHVGSFVTPVAPYLLEIQTGYEFTCTQSKDSEVMSYRLQMAKVNKENGGKVTEGFRNDWSTDYTCKRFGDVYTIGDYPISKKISTKAVQLPYTNDEPQIPVSKAGYARVSSVVHIDGSTFVSAPSNVLSCKKGADPCYIIGFAGIRYDVNDAKKNQNKENKYRAQIHWKRINGEDPGDFDWDTTYIHGTKDDQNTGTCAKSGMVFFWGRPDESDIKAYELLRSDQPNGTYKKLKTYALNAPDLLEVYRDEESNWPVYAMQYTSFPPEAEYWYAIRAVSKTGNTPGARGEGEKNKTEVDSVRDFMSMEGDPESIYLNWRHDDCVKQYNLYRADKSWGNIEELDVTNIKPYKKISGGSYKKYNYAGGVYLYHEFTDKGKNVETDKEYYYFVRPIYDTKKANDPKYNKVSSGEIKIKATAKYAEVKNFKGENNGIKDVQFTFNQTKRLTQYRLFRLKVDAAETSLRNDWKPDIWDEYKPGEETGEQFEERIDAWGLDQWKEFMGRAQYGGWEYVDTVYGDGKSTGKKTYDDRTVEVGDYYYYLIQGATDKTGSWKLAYSGQIQNLPMPVTNLKGEYGGSGNKIKLTWGKDKKDQPYWDKIYYEVSLDNGGSWEEVHGDTKYVDSTLKRGDERKYQVRVVFSDGGKTFRSKVSTKTCSLPVRIEVDGGGEYYVGDSVDIRGKAVKSDGHEASIHNISYSSMDGVLKGSDGHYTADHAGDAWVTLRCAGISKDVHVKVKNR